MQRPRLDSLFARLLLLQVLVAVALLLIFGTLVYVERNVAVARLVAEQGFGSPAIIVVGDVLRGMHHAARQTQRMKQDRAA